MSDEPCTSINERICRPLHAAFDRVDLSAELRSLIAASYREISVELPLLRSNGELALFRGYRVQHNRSRGPFKGGLRLHPRVTLEELEGLAVLMSCKTALVGIPFGGAKGGIDCEPADLSRTERSDLVRLFVDRLGELISPETDIMAPDVGSDERLMASIYDAYSVRHGDSPAVVTGKPLELFGIDGRLEATGRGVALMTGWVAEKQGIGLDGTRVSVQGFGKVGSHTARYLQARGARVVAVSDHTAAIHQENGIDIHELMARRQRDGNHTHLEAMSDIGERLPPDDLFEIESDVLIPAAMEDAIDETNAENLPCRMVVEAANSPTTPGAEETLASRGIPVVPDILANAGGVVVSYFEWVQNRQGWKWSRDKVEREAENHLSSAWNAVCARSGDRDLSYRQAAYDIAVGALIEAHALRGYPDERMT